MNVDEWLDCTNPAAMLEFLQNTGRASERKLRLFACACCRRIWGLLPPASSRQTVELVELALDGEETPLPWWGTFVPPNPPSQPGRHAEAAARYPSYSRTHLVAPFTAYAAAEAVAEAAGEITEEAARRAEQAAKATLLRDIVNPFHSPRALSGILAWNGGLVKHFAESAYQERRLPHGTLDNARLAVLADALEDAGCLDSVLLDHLRGAGPHVRGCFALDQLLGKEAALS